jgi:hypothetical protein
MKINDLNAYPNSGLCDESIATKVTQTTDYYHKIATLPIKFVKIKILLCVSFYIEKGRLVGLENGLVNFY